MKLTWNALKNERLRSERNVSFEQVEEAVVSGKVLEVTVNSSPKYSGQRILVVSLNGYAHVVPMEKTGNDEWELKTIFPSRVMQRKFGVKNED